ncbi:MAG: hypothetical protein WBC42_01225 [Candidatus Zixiibacteriota bacterium]
MIRECPVVFILVCLLGCACAGTGYQTSRPDEEMNSGVIYPDEEMNHALIYGENFTFGVTAPEGWVLDYSSGVPLGLDGLFYPEESSWQETTVDMYAKVRTKRREGQETIEEIMLRDISRFKREAPDVVIEDAPGPLFTRDGRTATVKYFKNSARRNYEAVAYINESKIVVLFVLGSDTAKEFEASLSSFEKLVASYFFMDVNVKVIE